MSPEAWIAIAVVLGTLVALITVTLPPYLILMGALTVLSVSGVLSSTEAFAGFGNTGLMTVAVMFIVAGGITSTGGVQWIVQNVLGRPSHIRSAIFRVFAPVAGLSGFLNNTPVVATMIPAINTWCRRIDAAPSRLMIPLSYSAILGGTLTMIGTSTNLVVNGQYQDLTGEPGFGLFAITLVGLPVAVVGGLFIIFVLPRILPDRRAPTASESLREFTVEVAVDATGPLVGKTIEQAGLRNLRTLFLVEIGRQGTVLSAVAGEETLLGNDRLVFAGDPDAIKDLLAIRGIQPSVGDKQQPTILESRPERRLVEAVVSTNCDAVGRTLKDSRFRERYGAVVLAVSRNGQRIKGGLGSIRIEAGDSLLMEARPGFVSKLQNSRDFLLISDLDVDRPRHDKAGLAWSLLIAAVLAAATGLLSILDAGLLAAAGMLVTRCMTPAQALRTIDLPILITIGASLGLGAALASSGAANAIAELVVSIAGDRPILLLVLIYVTVQMLTEMITNNGAAVIMVPIALSLTEQLSLAPAPYLFAVMMAASASFATPLGYQTNLMVYGPGQYRMTDFLKAGIPMNIIVGVTTVVTLVLSFDLRA
ncbi:SLC13 family permease [Abyssibacter profundi]|uniref:SLC13 family permease n=1 Tax=Abyssibacter profundi TaxID=2182787 RepID=A0A363UN53_9GAMM|nr:SLC13 family permease [Abyssibacter profundi]PWN56856.1 SLC13 family permease [Abyssibacter profundi]